jgi:pyoverdine/dityrosine biosynthesis protein Dit1
VSEQPDLSQTPLTMRIEPWMATTIRITMEVQNDDVFDKNRLSFHHQLGCLSGLLPHCDADDIDLHLARMRCSTSSRQDCDQIAVLSRNSCALLRAMSKFYNDFETFAPWFRNRAVPQRQITNIAHGCESLSSCCVMFCHCAPVR